MNLFNTICAWLAIIAAIVLVVALVVMIWFIPIWTVAKITLTSMVAALFFGVLATAPIW